MRRAALGVAGAAVAGEGFDLAIAREALAQGRGATGTAWKKPAVIDVRNQAWREGDRVNAAVIRDMLNQGVMKLSGKRSVADAWGAFVGRNEKVGIKVNALSRNHTRAADAIVAGIIEGLQAAGVPKRNVYVVEARRPEGTGAIDESRGEEINFGAGKTRLTRFITDQIDVLINVPDLKDHGAAGITGALKNLSHAHTLVTDPGRFHGNHCSPYIAEINAMRPINTKRRLNICNGLLGVYNGGPGTGNPRFHWPHNGLLFSADPVAMDRVCLEVVNRQRMDRGLAPIRHDGKNPEYLFVARDLGLGECNLEKIDWQQV